MEEMVVEGNERKKKKTRNFDENNEGGHVQDDRSEVISPSY